MQEIKKVTRNSVWQTNSSATHAICFKADKLQYDTIPLNQYGNIELSKVYFGQSFEKYKTAKDKAEYIFAYIHTIEQELGYIKSQAQTSQLSDHRAEIYLDLFKACKCDISTLKNNVLDIIRKHTGCKQILFVQPQDKHYGINHQAFRTQIQPYQQNKSISTNAMMYILSNKERIKQFIFNSRFSFVTSGDGDGINMQNLSDCVSLRYTIQIEGIDEVFQTNDYSQQVNDYTKKIDSYYAFGLLSISDIFQKHIYQKRNRSVSGVQIQIHNGQKYLVVDSYQKQYYSYDYSRKRQPQLQKFKLTVTEKKEQ